jgi:Na+:H+ antiporter, NhaA family
MMMPALVFFGLNYTHPENWAGWAIPSATDIAFALCILILVGRNIPPAVKIFLLAIAIFDDLGAILVIAFFYSGALNLTALALTGLGIFALYALNRAHVSIISPYLLVGIYMWFCLYHAGIHTTVGGVLVGLFIPMYCRDNQDHSPVNQSIHFLHPWVGFIILPLFAFTSAGINFVGVSVADILKPLPLGIALALFFGKQIGIFGITFALIKSGLVKMPQGATWLHLYGVSVLAGIGFTMSLFIGILAFPEAMQNAVKIGVIGGSLLSTVWGAVILWVAHKKQNIHL